MRRDPGRVYVATNPKGWTKIGRTRQPVARRIAQLNDPRSEYYSFGPWFHVSHVYSDRHCDLEAKAHARLRWWRVKRGVGSCREIFDVAPGKALDIINRLNRGGGGGLGGSGRFVLFLACVVIGLFLATLIGSLP